MKLNKKLVDLTVDKLLDDIKRMQLFKKQNEGVNMDLIDLNIFLAENSIKTLEKNGKFKKEN
jgi:hypothetical protein